jgi:pimeloyl-ACP methyl ester carboxylesterase
VRDQVAAMTRRALELQGANAAQSGGADSIDLASIRAPALALVGERDREDFKRIAERLADELADARGAVIADAAHLPAMERPQQTAAHVNAFLRELAGAIR